MSYFLCLALPRKVSKKMLTAFHPNIHFTNVSTLPIGIATKGRKDAWDAYLLQVGSSSASLIGKGSARKNARINDQSDYFALGVESLMETEEYLSLSFLAHWMHGYIETEAVSVHAEKSVEHTQLRCLLLNLEEDTRYLVSNIE